MEKLAENFSPGPFDVICARGKEAYTHAGNRSFRATLEFHLDSYANAGSKQEKTEIVSLIFNAIQAATADGGFIRKNEEGHWCRVPNHVAREKVGQGFRDLLHTEYRSSTKAKIERRRARSYTTQKPPPSAAAEDRKPLSVTRSSEDENSRAAMPPLLGTQAHSVTRSNDASSRAAMPPLLGAVSKSFSYDSEPLPWAQGGSAQMDILRQCSFSFIREDQGTAKMKSSGAESTAIVTPKETRTGTKDRRGLDGGNEASHPENYEVAQRNLAPPQHAHRYGSGRSVDSAARSTTRTYPGQQYPHPPQLPHHLGRAPYNDVQQQHRAPAWQERAYYRPSRGGSNRAIYRYDDGRSLRGTKHQPPSRRYR